MTDQELVQLVADAISKAASPRAAAKSVAAVCRRYADEHGMKPDTEVALRKPWEPRCYGTDESWYVSFEAGPYEWAVGASLSVDTGGKVLAEPYYSFDLCLTPV